MEEHAVIVKFSYLADGLDPLFDLEERLEAAIRASGAGEYDGHEIAIDLSDGSLYMYGPDAEVLFDTVKPLLIAAKFLRNAAAVLRFGPPADGVVERVVAIDS